MKTVKLVLLISFPLSALGQYVGIGTPTPTGKLQVNHRSLNAIGLRLVDSSNNLAGSVEYRNVNRPVGMYMRGYTESDFYNGQYVDVISDSSFVATFRGNGMLGIRTGTPLYPLHVNGDINTTGALRVSGDAGSSGQVLRSNGDGTMDWRSMQFDNIATFRTSGAGSWVVPAGVTRIMAEAWGAGAGGTAYCGGGGGGYIAGFFSVTPGATINFNIGDGGAGAHATAINGQNTTVTTTSGTLTANGGAASVYVAPNLLAATGGNFSAAGTTSFFGQPGQSGASGASEFMQSSATTYLEYISGAHGGNAGNSVSTGAQGFTFLYNLTTATVLRTKFGSIARQPGGGGDGGYYSGPSAFGNGGSGADGMVSIHW